VFVHRVRGEIEFKTINAALAMPEFLPKPTLIEYRYDSDTITNNSEFRVRINQPIPPHLRQEVLRVLSGYIITLYFGQLDIVVKSEDYGTEAKLPLWDGIRYGVSDQPFSSRTISPLAGLTLGANLDPDGR
jgi:hypothetical protein